MDGPTRATGREQGSSWQAKPLVAGLLGAVSFLAPIAGSFGFCFLMARRFPASYFGLPWLLWWVLVAIGGICVMLFVERLSRRLVPLSTLLRMHVVFPDRAAPKYRQALRTGTSRAYERQLAEYRETGQWDDSLSYGEYMLELLQAVRHHDPLTRGHSERVRAMTNLIAAEMGLPEEDQAKLHWAAMLHDVGKLDVPPEILNKPGAPDDEEWQILKSHPGAAEVYLEPLVPWLGEWTKAASEHHLRWDGGGYPKDLAGTDISLAGRIVAVADAYDVMTSKRSYKEAQSSIDARAEIARCSGSQFDPAVVRAFLNIGVSRIRIAGGPLGWIGQFLGYDPFSGAIMSSGVGGLSSSAAVGVAKVSVAALAVTTGATAIETVEFAPVPETLAFDTAGEQEENRRVVGGRAASDAIDEQGLPIPEGQIVATPGPLAEGQIVAQPTPIPASFEPVVPLPTPEPTAEEVRRPTPAPVAAGPPSASPTPTVPAVGSPTPTPAAVSAAGSTGGGVPRPTATARPEATTAPSAASPGSPTATATATATSNPVPSFAAVPTATSVPTPTSVPNSPAVPTPTATATSVPAATPTSTSVPATISSPTATAAAVPSPTPTSTAVELPTATSLPGSPTSTPAPTATATSTSVPTATATAAIPTPTSVPNPTATGTSVPAATPTSTSAPTPTTTAATPTPTTTAATPTATSVPTPTATAAIPTATSVPTPTATAAIPTATSVPTPTATAAIPTATSVPTPTATATSAPTPTATAVPVPGEGELRFAFDPFTLLSQPLSVDPEFDPDFVLYVYFFFWSEQDFWTSVDFWIDDPTGTGAPFRTEYVAPYDLMGTQGNVIGKPANGFDIASLPPGEHSLTARANRADGPPLTVVEFFTVAECDSCP